MSTKQGERSRVRERSSFLFALKRRATCLSAAAIVRNFLAFGLGPLPGKGD
jgi:hypothetical protein